MKIGDISFYGLLPVIAFTIWICALTMFRSLNRTNHALHRVFGAVGTVAVSIFVLVSQIIRWRQFDSGALTSTDTHTLSSMVVIDRVSVLSIGVLSVLVAIVALVAYSYLSSREDIPSAEFFILLSCVAVGMFAMAMANDFISMFVALEVFSIPLYVLCAFDRRRVRSLEAGFKYFIMGAVSSAIFLYGIALHYGVSGSTGLVPPSEISTIASVSTVLILSGLLFKVAAVPFHFWSPDAYQGAPSPITIFMSGATKLVAFVALVRIVASGAIDVSTTGTAGRITLTIATVGSALIGSVLALRQANIKRAIAYSSISHTAYILLALKAGSSEALSAVMTYVILYAFIVAGTFIVISLVSSPTEQKDSLGEYKGLARRHPYLAGSLTILLFAQAGIPLTSGFIAKFDVFRAAFAGDLYVTGIVVLIATVIAAAFYLRIVLALYADSFEEHESAITEKSSVPLPASIALGLCVIVTVAVGILPSLLTALTHSL